MKKILSIMLSLLMVFSVIPFTMMSASAEGEEFVYQTVLDMSDYDGATLNQYDSPWFTKGLTRSYNIGKTAYSYDAETDSMKITRDAWDPCGLYYFDDSLGVKFSDSLGFRVWIKGDAGSGANVTANNNFLFAVDTVDDYGDHVVYGAYGYDNPAYKVVVSAEGAWVEIRWADIAKSWKVVGANGMNANRPTFYMSGSAIAPETILSKVDGFVVGFKETGSKKTYYVGDVQLIKPYVTVTVDGQDFKSISGEKIILPEPKEENVIGYSDGKNLYKGGDEYVVPGNIELTNITSVIDENSEHKFEFDTTDKTYTGSEICPSVTCATLEEGVDYTVEYKTNLNAGTGKIYIRGTGETYFDIYETFTINKKEFEDSDFVMENKEFVYTGKGIQPKITSEIFREKDYKLTYKNNTKAGENTASVTISSTDKNGTGEIVKTFSISPKGIADSDFSFDLENKVYTGDEIKPAVTAKKLTNGTDFVVSYSENISAGTAKVIVEGIGNYTGEIEKTFEIVPKEITVDDFTVDTDDKVYTAKEICPQVTSILGEDDYEVAYSNNVDTGVATITITGKGNYAGTLTYEFVILQKEAVAEDFVIDLEDKVYTGKAIEPSVTSDVLKAEDYVVAYENNIDVGTATIIITGMGNCKGQFTKTFTIKTRTITAEDFALEYEETVYTGSAIEPKIITELPNTDYEVEYKDNVNVGTATVTITGKNNCEGTVTLLFKVAQKEIKEADFTVNTDSKTYTGFELTTDIASSLVKGTDYEVEYKENVNAGTATVTITGIGNYTGKIEYNFDITPATFTAEDFVLEYETVVFSGNANAPKVSVVENPSISIDSNEFEVSYSNNINVGTATVTITGIGNFLGCTVTKEFAITAKSIAENDFTVDTSDKVYTGSAIETEIVSALVKDTDYTVTYEHNVNIGTATVTIKGIGNYTGTLERVFVIVKKEITVDDFTVDTSDKVYTGTEFTPEVTSVLGEDNYTVAYNNNVTAGTATITIQGVNNCDGTVTFTFEILKKGFENDNFALSGNSFVYTGEEIKPEVVSAVIPTEAYEVFYTDNVNVGTATVTIVTRDDNYSGEVVLTFTITEKEIKDDDFALEGESFVYTGEEIKPEVVSDELELDVDYTVSYESNVTVGTATVTIKGIGNYSGTVTKTFEITQKAITLDDFVLNLDAEVYTGLEIFKAIESQLELDVDYTAEYKDNVNAGNAVIVFTGIGNYTGVESVSFEIARKAITADNFVVDNSNVVYTGKAFTKSVLSALELGKDYTVEFKNNVNVGTASVVITGIGNYNGVLTYNFTIAKPKVDKVKKATAKSTAKKKVTVKWKKVSGANGYVITYSMNKKFKKGKKFGTKTVTVANAKAAKRVINKLKSGNKYFVKVAAYKNYKDSKGKTLKVISKYTKVKKAVTVK